MKKVLVCGAGGFIGTHLTNKLKDQGHYVIGADLKYPEYSQTRCDQFYQVDLSIADNVAKVISPDIDEIYQLAADMGGAGYIFTGDNDADLMTNSALINLNVCREMLKKGVRKVFYSSSACMYPEHNQLDSANPNCEESSAYPADPDSEYGWEKLFSERLYLSYARNHGFDVRIARLHNVFGPLSAWNNGREKAPAALCRKVLESNGTVEVWGTGQQTRSFLYIDECLDGIERLMNSDFKDPINLGSDFMISVNDLVMLISIIDRKEIVIKNIPGPVGVNGRNSDNRLIQKVLGWSPENNLAYGLRKTYEWIKDQM